MSFCHSSLPLERGLPLKKVCLLEGGRLPLEGGGSAFGGGLPREGVLHGGPEPPCRDTLRYSQSAVGMHTTGMHSCSMLLMEQLSWSRELAYLFKVCLSSSFLFGEFYEIRNNFT